MSCCRGVACIEQLLGCHGLLPTGQVQDGLEDRIRVAEEGYQMLSARPARAREPVLDGPLARPRPAHRALRRT